MLSLNPSSLPNCVVYSKDDPDLREKIEKECLEMDLECAICLEAPFIDPHEINVCHHVFCKVCVDALKEKTCPLCRRVFTAKQVASAKDKQTCIDNLWKRCVKEVQDAKEKSSDDQKKPNPALEGKKVEQLRMSIDQLRISSSSQSEQKFTSSSHMVSESSHHPVPRQQADNFITVGERLQLAQMVQSIFSSLADDQSMGLSRKPTYKTTWSDEQRAKVRTLKEFWNTFSMGNSGSMNSYLDALENVAFGLSDIAKDQIASLHISGNSRGQNITRVYQSGGATIRMQQNGGMVITGGTGDVQDISTIFNLSRNIHNENVLFEGQNSQTYVDGQEVLRSDASIIHALTKLDKLLLECFSKRYTRGDFAKTFIALTKVSSESIEMQHDALISLCDYCGNLLQADNLQELLEQYNMLIQEKGGIALLGKITENLISQDHSYKEKIRIILAALNDLSVNTLKNHVIETIQDSHFEESSLKLLYLCEEHKEWCTEQVGRAIKTCIKDGNESMATRLIDKYLMNHRTTRKIGRHYLRNLIKKNIKKGHDGSATKLIEKYFLSNPKRHGEGMNHIRALLSENIKNGYDAAATSLIDKYFLNDPLIREEGMNHVRALLSKNIKNGYDAAATSLIDKYFLNDPSLHEEGMKNIRTLLSKNIKNGYDAAATSLIDKYFLNDPSLREEGMNHIRALLSKNIEKGYTAPAAALRRKYRI